MENLKNRVSARSIMTRKVITVTPDTPLTQAAETLVKNSFSGLPVLDPEKRVVGLLSDFDLITRSSSVHLPTLFKLLDDFPVYRKDKKFLSDNIGKILALKVSDIMNREFVSVGTETPLEEIISIFAASSKANPLPVMGKDGKIAGIISRHDLAKLIGSPYSFSPGKHSDRQLDRNIEGFLSRFGRQFVFVSKFRTNYWLAMSLFFALLGFIIAFAIIVRIK